MAAPRYSGAKKNAISLVQSCIISYIPLSYSINSPKTMTDETIKALDDIIEAEVRRRVNIVESTLQESQINVPTVSVPSHRMRVDGQGHVTTEEETYVPNYPHKPAPDFAIPPLGESEPTREMVVDERIGAIEKHMEFIDGHVYPAVPDLINRMDKLEDNLRTMDIGFTGSRDKLYERIAELEDKVRSESRLLSDYENRIAKIGIKQVELDKGLSVVEDYQRSGLQRISNLEKRIASKTESLRKLNVDRFDELESKADSAGAMLDDIDKRLNHVEVYSQSNRETMESVIQDFGDDIHQIKNDVERIDRLMEQPTVDWQERCYQLKNEVEHLTETVRDLTKGVHWAQQHIEALERHTNILKKGTTDSPITLT